MMKKLFFWLVFFSIGMQAQNVAFADANFKALLLSSSSSNTIAQNLNGDYFAIDADGDGDIQIAEAENVSYLNLAEENVTNVEGILNFINLEHINTFKTNISHLDVHGLKKLTYCDFSKMVVVLNAEGCSSLMTMQVGSRSDINASSLINVNLKDCQSLPYFMLGSLKISKLNLENCVSLQEIDLFNNSLESLNVKNCIGLKKLSVEQNNLHELILDNTPNIEGLYISNNNLTWIDTSSLINLKLIYCNQNNLSSLDFSQNKKLEVIAIMNNPSLQTLFIKNGKHQYIEEFEGAFSNTNIKYICADDSEIEEIKSNLVRAGKTANVNSYCSFTPGGNFNTISGTVKFDANNNGCDASDNAFEFLKLQINDGTNSGETFAQNDGKYEFYTQTGNFNLTAVAENPGLFSISPATFSTSFTDNNNNVFNQDICVTANGNQNDAEVVIAPLTNARPGFDATYKLVWRNKGNTTLSGKVVLNYDASKMTFQNSSLPYSVASNGTLEFDYTNLKPFENTASEITFTINTPTHTTNPVNSGDILAFNAQITPNSTDLTPDDNNFGFNHTVVNSFDPNDIVCLEGETIPSVAVGKYLHYVVNFENTGTAEAENIVVKMDINPAEFDINTLQLQNASADVMTKITGNKVEFIFKKIKLQSGGHGNVLLKVRSLNTLQEGDNVTNSAEIYFDYNFPIDTKDYITEIQDETSVLKAKINYEANQFSNNNYPVDFDGSLSTGTITNYLWEFSGTPTVSSTTVASPSVVYNVPGNYTAKLTVSDADNKTSTQTISFSIGGNSADISTGKASDGNLMSIDSDDDDWKGYDVNGTEMTPKVRQTFSGWSYADIGNGNNSRWISLNNFEGYYTYKSREFAIPENATDAKLNLRSLSFVRNWTYLVKVNPDGSEDDIEITKTQWLGDGFKGWLNSRSPKVDNYSLSPGRYYIKVLVFSNNSSVRQSLDVNAIVSCSAGLIFANKRSNVVPTLGNEDLRSNEISVYPIPTNGEVTVVAKENLKSIELYDSAGRILQNQILSLPSKNVKFNINANQGVYYLKIKTENKVITRKVIKK